MEERVDIKSIGGRGERKRMNVGEVEEVKREGREGERREEWDREEGRGRKEEGGERRKN